MNDNNLKYAKSERKSNKFEITKWKQIDWKKAEEFVNRLQIRIVKAEKTNKKNLVKRLQYLLVNSFYAKAIAVRKVTNNRGKKTAGIDGEIWKTEKQKLKAIKSLDTKRYKAMPTRRIYIKKPNGKLRPLSIPTMKDRAMQTLYMLALQPIAETNADKGSFGFRMYRSCQDAMERIFTVLSHKNAAEWILEGDIKGCFDNISHEWMLEHVKMGKKILSQFVKAGYVYQKNLFPNSQGAMQGGAISPTLANITLDGLEEYIHNNINLGKRVKILKHREHKINFIRYADDFIITGESKETLEKVKSIVSEFMKERGLQLSDEKTIITHITKGFDFLGWNFRKYRDNKLIIKPAKKSVKKVIDKIRKRIKENSNQKQETLIKKLNPVIIGWSNYHQVVCAKETFQKLDYTVYKMLKHWAKRRHNNKGRYWIYNKYWNNINGRNNVFEENNIRLKKFADVPIIRKEIMNLNKNPYLDRRYYQAYKIRQQAKREKAYKNLAVYELGYNDL